MKKQSQGHYLGVEWVGDQLRAGVFDASWRLKGKAMRSSKTQRGSAEVLKRIATCALDAVDEADLNPADIVAAAILTNGHGSGQTWGPQEVNQLASHLPPRTGSNLLTAGRVATIMWAVHEHEMSTAQRSWLGLFTEPVTAFYVADRAQSGKVKLITVGNLGANVDAGSTPESRADNTDDLLTAIRLSKPEILLLVGPDYEDTRSTGTKRVRESLLAAGHDVPIHIPEQAAHVGVWAAARLAARTFGLD